MDSTQTETLPTDAPPSPAAFLPGAEGITVPSNLNRHDEPLTEVITELGFADRDTVERAVDATQQTAERPEHYLLASGAIDERQLSMALAERGGLPHVDLDRFEVDSGAVAIIGKAAAASFAALPIAVVPDGALLVAIEDPYNTQAIGAIEEIARNEVRPVIAPGTQIRRLIDELPEEASPPPPDPASERNGSQTEAAEVDAGPLSATLDGFREKMGDLENLIDTVEQARRQSAERERELEEQLSEAQERIAALEEHDSKTAMMAGELANAASERLTALQGLFVSGRSNGSESEPN